MSGQSGQIDGGSLLASLWAKDPDLAQTLQTIVDGANKIAQNAGVSATGDITPPKAPDTVAVKVSGELMHVAITHNGPLQRGIRYFSEISNDSSFGQPIVIDHGTSRTSHPIPLPTFPDGGGTKTGYHVRSYAQNPGGPPSGKTVAQGGPFTMGGTTQMTLLPSTGSGTAPSTGQSAGQGLGNNQSRLK